MPKKEDDHQHGDNCDHDGKKEDDSDSDDKEVPKLDDLEVKDKTEEKTN